LTLLRAAVRFDGGWIGAKTLKVHGLLLSKLFLSCTACIAIAGCGVRETHIARAPANVPLQTASKSDLVSKYNRLAQSITSINAGVEMQWTSSSTYTGIVKQYPRVSGFILAQKPQMVRVIGQAPVISTNIFDMVSDGKTFSVYIPSKNQFLTGPATLAKPSTSLVENLRPQDLMEAILWQAIPESEPVLFEQATDNSSSDYVLTLVTTGGSASNWAISRKIWFERAGLTMARIQTFGNDGQLESDIRYDGWTPFGSVQYPKQITLTRPADGYTLVITVTKMTPNATIEASRFVLQQPTGAKLVHVGEDTGSGQP
jgi:outer membrane lipoprotein-sorting protein